MKRSLDSCGKSFLGYLLLFDLISAQLVQTKLNIKQVISIRVSLAVNYMSICGESFYGDPIYIGLFEVQNA